MKTCGTCNLCCKVLHIASLDKPPGVWCPHARPGRGCAIHGSHPDDCRAFLCGWLMWADLGDIWKPTTARFLVRSEPGQGRLCIDVDPGFPEAWKAPAYYPTIKGWSAGVRTGERCVIVYAGDRTTVVFPEEDLVIGSVDPDDSLAVGYVKGRSGVRPLVRRLRDGAVVDEWRGALSAHT